MFTGKERNLAVVFIVRSFPFLLVLAQIIIVRPIKGSSIVAGKYFPYAFPNRVGELLI